MRVLTPGYLTYMAVSVVVLRLAGLYVRVVVGHSWEGVVGVVWVVGGGGVSHAVLGRRDGAVGGAGGLGGGGGGQGVVEVR